MSLWNLVFNFLQHSYVVDLYSPYLSTNYS